ncbi:uncharacterized protein [Dermacentor andersoni]|uniref:uncharacterized protein n=1 Tax=Dermacentor andersoni TaxID=34620 RepID=UPI00215576D8|nr:uncharacterized protein LOC126524543 [Dermacentor andersoni]
MSSDAEDARKKYEIALAIAAVASLEMDVEASSKRVRDIRRRLIANNCLLTALASSRRAVQRRVWAYRRHEQWFEKTLPNLGSRHFKQSFRVSETTFRYLVDVCRPAMQRQATNMRECVALEKRVAVSLYKLCSCAEDRAIADIFGIGRSTVNVIYREFCATVVATLEKEWVKMPSPDDMPAHIKEFQAVCDFPQGVGALDGCRIPVSPPKEHASDYYNYKGWYSIILLALVDHKYRFRYVNVGSPGRCHDAYVYRQSVLADMVEGPLFQAPTATISGVVVPPLILCDQAFPLTSNLMKPFKSFGENDLHRSYNYNLSRSRRIVENAFGRLKARFRLVLKKMDADITNVPMIVRACCVLHNICEHFSDSLSQQWLQESDIESMVYVQPEHSTDVQVGSGPDVRGALVEYYREREGHQSL